VRTNDVIVRAAVRLAVVGFLTAEFFPVLEPRAAGALVLRCSVDVLDFHDDRSFLCVG